MSYEGIAISGKAASGKDTLFTYLADELAKRGKWAARVAFADPLKQDVRTLFGLEKTDPGGRDKILSYAAEMRAACPDYFIRRTWKDIEGVSAYGMVPILCDVRYVNELSFVKTLGFLTVRVDATHADRSMALAARGEDSAIADSLDESEYSLDDARFDVRFANAHDDGFSRLAMWTPEIVNLFDGSSERI